MTVSHIFPKYQKRFFGKQANEFRGFEKEKLLDPPQTDYDPFYFLQKRDSKTVIDYINQENEYWKSIMTPSQSLIDSIYQEIINYDPEIFFSCPYTFGDDPSTLYFTMYPKKKKCIHARQKKDSCIEILFDEEEFQDEVYNVQYSENHEYISFGVETNGNEEYRFHVRRIPSTEDLDWSIPLLYYGRYFWIRSSYIGYTLYDMNKRAKIFMIYELKTKKHYRIYSEELEEFSIYVTLNEEERFIFIYSGNNEEEMVYFVDTLDEKFTVRLFLDRINGDHKIIHFRDEFYVLTNHHPKKKKHIYKTSSFSKNLQEFMPYRPWREILSMFHLKEYLCLETKIHHQEYIIIYHPGTDLVLQVNPYEIKQWRLLDWNADTFPQEPVDSYYSIRLGKNYHQDQTILNCIVSWYHKPKEFMYIDIIENRIIYYHSDQIENFDPEEYASKIIHVEDKIPMSMVYKTSTHSFPVPVYLTGYGAYGMVDDIEFSRSILPLLNQGFIYAVAHVRGGGFYGYEWHSAGKKTKKQQSIDDLIRCAEFLIKTGMTTPSMLVVEGTSAGGLLVASAMIQKPDLFQCVLLISPFLDYFFGMSDSTTPLVIDEWSEWGNPNEEEFFTVMRKICPYYNMEKKNYPYLYLSAGYHDARCQYWETLKFIAKLRLVHQQGDKNWKVLQMKMNEGHFVSFLDQDLEIAQRYAFIYRSLCG